MTEAPIPKVQLATPSSSEVEIVRRINDTFSQIERATRETVPRAIELGVMLITAKNDYGRHGNWGRWLKDNCKQISERTAQLYMELANGRLRIETELAKRSDPATVAVLISELSLRGALQLLKGSETSGTHKANGTKETKVPTTKNEAYDKANAQLIKKLEALPPEDAETKADDTINALKDIVRIKTSGTRKAA